MLSIIDEVKTLKILSSQIYDSRSRIRSKTIIPIINQEQNIIFIYHLNTLEFEQITLNPKGLN